MKLSNLRNEIYLNSNSKINGFNNSVYDLLIKNNNIYIPDYRNNKLLIYDAHNKKIIDQLKIPNPHSVYYDDNKLIITTYKNSKIYFYYSSKKKEIIENNKFYRPICITKNEYFYLLVNWTKKKSDKLVLFDKKFNFIKKIAITEKNFFPHYAIFNKKNFFVVNHCFKNPKIFVLDTNGNLIKEIKNKYIKDPVSIKYLNNNYFICDYMMNSVNIFDEKFNLKYIYNHGLNFPMNVALFKNRLFVSEELSNRIFSLKIKL